MGVHGLLAEGRVGRAFELARDERVFLGHHVVVGPLREFGRHARASAELIEIARAGDVFEVEAERAVGLAGRARLAVAAAVGRLEPVAAPHLPEFAPRVRGLRVGVERVDRIAVRRPADMRHLFLAPGESLEEEGGDAVIMVGPVGLDVAVVGVEAEAGGDARRRAHLGVAPQRFIAPGIAAVAVVEDLGGAGIEDHAVQRDAPGGHRPAGRPAWRGLRVGRDLQAIILFRDRVRVAAVGEPGHRVVGDAVGFDHALVAADGDRDFVPGGRGDVGRLQGGALGGEEGDAGGEQRQGGVHGAQDKTAGAVISCGRAGLPAGKGWHLPEKPFCSAHGLHH